MKSQKKYGQTFSLELFPTKTDAGYEKQKAAVSALTVMRPKYLSVTFGAGGSTQEKTFSTVDWLRGQGLDTAPHLSCIGSSRADIIRILNRYKDIGIRRVVALRGDLPSGSGLGGLGELSYANELVDLIRSEFADSFHIEVAAYPEFHPQATSATDDLRHFQHKVAAGANGAITQYFFNADAYFRFIDSCERLQINVPIVPGIMPITNFTQLARFSDGCGAEIPRWLRKRLEAYGDDIESIRAFGTEVVTSLCQTLLDAGAPGLHFYTMNQSAPTLAIWQNLSLATPV